MSVKRRKCYILYGRFAALAAAVGLMAALSGCGQDREEAASATSVVQPAAVADTGEETEIPDVTGTQIEMDEETRHQLTVQLLEENGKDVSVAESERSTKGCVFEVPEGFAESPDVDNLYVTERYPIDASMICYEVMDGDPALQLMTEDMFKEEAEAQLQQTYGENVSLTIDSYESISVSGFPAFRILCHYGAEGLEITQLQYVINADKTYTVTYSQTNDYDWMEAFAQSAGTIRVKE